MRVDLSPELERLVKARLASGRYRDSEHVLSDALRILETTYQEPEGTTETLRALIAEGEASGEPEPYDMAAIQAGLDRDGPGPG